MDNEVKGQKEVKERKLGPVEIRKITRLQRIFRRRNDRKRIALLTEEASFLKADRSRNKDPSTADIRSKAVRQGNRVIGQTSCDNWMEILAFSPELSTLTSVMATCQLLREITRFNLFWMPVLQHHFPAALKTIQGQNNQPDTLPIEINWKNKVKELTLVQQAFRQVIQTLQEQKEAGNFQFRQSKWQEASKSYNEALKFAREPKNNLQKFQDILTPAIRIEYHHVLSVLYANAAQAELKMENHERAFFNGVRAEQSLKTIKKLMNKPDKFKQQFGQLYEKVKYRIREALGGLGPVARFVNYSSQPVEGLQQGSLLTHSHRDFSGFFDDSKVLMTEMTDRSTIGLIINKTYTPEENSGARPILIGGPCEPDHISTLHNVATAPGARRVIEGVYTGGDLSDYKNGERGVIIREYHGYASWFSGQLQGEILNSQGWDLTNDVAAEFVFNPDQMFEFEEASLRF